MSEKSERLIRRLVEHYGDPTEELHQAYSPWLDEMSSREGAQLVPFEFDVATHPEQSVLEPVTEAVKAYPLVPDRLFYAGFQAKLSRSLGVLATSRLLNQLKTQPASQDDPTPLAERLVADQQDGKNTLVVTSHFRFAELGYVRGLEFVAKKDRSRIQKSGVLLSKLMSRQGYKGKKLADHFTPLGKVYWSYPQSASSAKYDIPTGASRIGNALFIDSLEKDLEGGGFELHASLSGSEIKPVTDELGHFSHYHIPDVQPSSANLLRGFDNALPVTMIKSPINGEWQLQAGELIDVQTRLYSDSPAEVADDIYGNITSAVEKFTKREVVYNRVAGRIGKTALEQGI